MSDKKTENNAQTKPAETKPAETKPAETKSEETKSEEPSKQGKGMFQLAKGKSVIILVLVTVWILAGISAFVYSLYCFTKSGTTAEKILGLILAMISGPFYFIYVAMYKAYCR
jgi:hypothetical protein